MSSQMILFLKITLCQMSGVTGPLWHRKLPWLRRDCTWPKGELSTTPPRVSRWCLHSRILATSAGPSEDHHDAVRRPGEVCSRDHHVSFPQGGYFLWLNGLHIEDLLGIKIKTQDQRSEMALFQKMFMGCSSQQSLGSYNMLPTQADST